MIFKSQQVTDQWDTWCFHHDGTYFLYYLISGDRLGEGFGVATSVDGVHYDDQGWALRASSEMVRYLGTGAVWKAPDFDRSGLFVCNYSEWRQEPNGRETQNILFAWSTDLVEWHKFGDEHMFRADEWHYDKYGRWDCIYPMPRAEGGYYGIWTAAPMALGYTEDGLTWHAMEPPTFEPEATEAGAFWPIGDKVYAMLGGNGAMWSYVADNVAGPYRRSPRNACLLNAGNTYFSRFLSTPEGLLVNHHSMSPGGVYAAPLKRAEVDSEGTLRLQYWEGNDALKGEGVAVLSNGPATPAMTLVTDYLNFRSGIVAEGTIQMPRVMAEVAGVYLYAGATGFAVRLLPGGVVEIGQMDAFGDYWGPQQRVDREWSFPPNPRFRLLARRGMMEFYLDEQLIECQQLTGTGAVERARIGVIGPRGAVQDVRAWEMSLPSD